MTQDGWNAEDGFAPTCPEPFQMTTPVNLAQVTAVLYPGQIRGGDYKAHGGFRFDSVASNAVPVVIPITGRIVQGARYLENSDVQYMFEIIHPCGMMIRFDHLLTLSPKFAAIAETLPVAQTDDSRTTQINPPVDVAPARSWPRRLDKSPMGKMFWDWGPMIYEPKTRSRPILHGKRRTILNLHNMPCVGLICFQPKMNRASGHSRLEIPRAATQATSAGNART